MTFLKVAAMLSVLGPAGATMAQTLDPRIELGSATPPVPARVVEAQRFGPDTSMRDLAAWRWDEPSMMESPNQLTCRIDDGGTLELVFDRAERLVYAVRRKPGAAERTLFANSRVMSRRLAQIDFSRPVSGDQLAAAWGERDVSGGSGIVTYFWRMADGATVRVTNFSRRCIRYMSVEGGSPTAPPRVPRRLKPCKS